MSNNTPHASEPALDDGRLSAPAGSLKCKDVADHDLENAVRAGRAKWLCPKCNADVSLAYVMWCAAEEWVRKGE